MKSSETIHNDVEEILSRDGVETVILGDFDNQLTTSVEDLKKRFGEIPWAARVVYNNRFGGFLIHQLPGQGNRLHYHPDADECWIILEGEWEWYVKGAGKRRVGAHDIIVVQKGTEHQITCVGDRPGIRFAISAPDVAHVYAGK